MHTEITLEILRIDNAIRDVLQSNYDSDKCLYTFGVSEKIEYYEKLKEKLWSLRRIELCKNYQGHIEPTKTGISHKSDTPSRTTLFRHKIRELNGERTDKRRKYN